MPKVESNGIQVHYQQTGQGPDLVLIHGLTGNLAVWHLKIVPALRPHFRVLSYDLRGHGYSDIAPTGYTTADMAADLLGLLDGLGIEKANLVGHSFGADTALHFALRHPERVERVVAVEAGLAAFIHLRKREEWAGWEYWVRALRAFGFEVPPERRTDPDYMLRMSLQVPKVYGPATGRPRKPGPLLRLLNETTMLKDYENPAGLTLERLCEIEVPILVIYGEGSAFLGTYEYLRRCFPNGTATLLPKSDWGHFGPLEQPELLVEHIRSYLLGVERGPEQGSSTGDGLGRRLGWGAGVGIGQDGS